MGLRDYVTKGRLALATGAILFGVGCRPQENFRFERDGNPQRSVQQNENHRETVHGYYVSTGINSWGGNYVHLSVPSYGFSRFSEEYVDNDNDGRYERHVLNMDIDSHASQSDDGSDLRPEWLIAEMENTRD